MAIIAWAPNSVAVGQSFFKLSGSISDRSRGGTFHFNAGGDEDTVGTLFDFSNDSSPIIDNTPTAGTWRVKISSDQNEDYIISKYGTINVDLGSSGYGNGTMSLIFPIVTILKGTFREFYIGTRGTECPMGTRCFELYTGTTFGSRVNSIFKILKSDTTPTSESRTRNWKFPQFDYLPFSDIFRQQSRRYPVEKTPITDTIVITIGRHGTITDWNFAPDYKVLFDIDNQGTSYATTNWHGNIQSFSSISKSLKHWTGDYQIGNWQPSLNDPDNELWGSLYGAGSEARYKSILLRAMINTNPLTYISQFAGQIERTEVSDGIITIDIKDKMKGLPDRKFIWDYKNIGSVLTDGRSWGKVKKVYGTLVMFDDFGNEQFIERKKPGVTIFESIFTGAKSGAIGLLSGNWIAGGIGFLGGIVSNLPKDDEIIGGYYQIDDFNVIPDDSVKSGAKIKFYNGSISGIATNLNHPLISVSERTSLGGTFIKGLYGTVAFDDVKGINIGDYLYVRLPMILSGSPNDITKAILTGSNIDVPYKQTETIITWERNRRGPWTRGMVPAPIKVITGDFANDWDTELESMDLMTLARNVSIEDDITPFELLKDLFKETQISFFIDEDNKFKARTVRPRGLAGISSIATYTGSINMLDGFKFSRSTDEVLSGYTIFYNFVGNGIGAFNNSYARRFDLRFKNSIYGIENWETIESKWIQSEDDAKMIAYRQQLHSDKGVDRIDLPTTLYGIIQSAGDIVRVNHNTGSLSNRLFEIESYQKDLTSSRITFHAIDVQRTYGYGNCQWYGSTITLTTLLQSGYSFIGPTGSNFINIGSISGTLLAGIPTLPNLDLYAVGLNNAAAFSAYRDWLVFFAPAIPISRNVEICRLVLIMFGTAFLSRGVFNSIPRNRFPNDTLYALGPAKYDNFGNLLPYTGTGFSLGTSLNINSNVGTAFKFF